MNELEYLRDLDARLEKAFNTLQRLKDDAFVDSEKSRLAGKAEGVALSRSYLHEYIRNDMNN